MLLPLGEQHDDPDINEAPASRCCHTIRCHTPDDPKPTPGDATCEEYSLADDNAKDVPVTSKFNVLTNLDGKCFDKIMIAREIYGNRSQEAKTAQAVYHAFCFAMDSRNVMRSKEDFERNNWFDEDFVATVNRPTQYKTRRVKGSTGRKMELVKNSGCLSESKSHSATPTWKRSQPT